MCQERQRDPGQLPHEISSPIPTPTSPPPTLPNPCCSLCNDGGVCDELCVMLQGIDSDVPRISLRSSPLSNAFHSHAHSPFSEMDEIAPVRQDVEYIMSHWTANDSPPINVPFEFLLADSKETPAGGVHQRVRLTALADTGAYDGYMTADFCTRHRIPYIPTPSSGRVMHVR